MVAGTEPDSKGRNGGYARPNNHRRAAGANTPKKADAVIERIHIESIRHRLGELVDTVVGAAVTGGPVTAASVDAFNELGTNVAADIGSELRKLEAQ